MYMYIIILILIDIIIFMNIYEFYGYLYKLTDSLLESFVFFYFCNIFWFYFCYFYRGIFTDVKFEFLVRVMI